MAEGSRSDGFQGAKTGPAGGLLPGRWNSRGRAMTFQVWGWRREDAPQVLAWVPDAAGGRGAAMRRGTPGEPCAGGPCAPGPSGEPWCAEEGRREGALGPGEMRGLAFGLVGAAARETPLRAWAGRGPRVIAAGAKLLPAPSPDLPGSRCRCALCLLVASRVTDRDGHR